MLSMAALSNRKLAQVAIAVKDIDAAAQRYATLLGVDVPNIIVTAPGNDVNATYRGMPTDCKAKLAFFDLGGVQLELIEPIGDDSAWAEGLRDGGETVHHLAFWTENLRDDKAVLEANGADMIQRGDMGDGQYAYFDGREPFGTMVELLEHKRTDLG